MQTLTAPVTATAPTLRDTAVIRGVVYRRDDVSKLTRTQLRGLASLAQMQFPNAPGSRQPIPFAGLSDAQLVDYVFSGGDRQLIRLDVVALEAERVVKAGGRKPARRDMLAEKCKAEGFKVSGLNVSQLETMLATGQQQYTKAQILSAECKLRGLKVTGLSVGQLEKMAETGEQITSKRDKLVSAIKATDDSLKTSGLTMTQLATMAETGRQIAKNAPRAGSVEWLKGIIKDSKLAKGYSTVKGGKAGLLAWCLKHGEKEGDGRLADLVIRAIATADRTDADRHTLRGLVECEQILIDNGAARFLEAAYDSAHSVRNAA